MLSLILVEFNNACPCYSSQGAKTSLKMGMEFKSPMSVIAGLGTRPADFAMAGYKTVGGENDRFITVYNESTGSIEAFWDKNIYLNPAENPYDSFNFLGVMDINQVDNTPRINNYMDYQRGNAIRAYLQAGNQHIPKFIPNASGNNTYLNSIRNEVNDGPF